MDPEDFLLVTTIDNSRYCKPNPKYYEDILATVNATPAESLMVGNDAEEDMAAAALGCATYLLTDYLINEKNADISSFRHGRMADFYKFVLNLPDVGK